jgi:hypothetical protein
MTSLRQQIYERIIADTVFMDGVPDGEVAIIGWDNAKPWPYNGKSPWYSIELDTEFPDTDAGIDVEAILRVHGYDLAQTNYVRIRTGLKRLLNHVFPGDDNEDMDVTFEDPDTEEYLWYIGPGGLSPELSDTNLQRLHMWAEWPVRITTLGGTP